MARELIFIFCYDISCSRRRAKVSDVLEQAGTRVQFSVFEVRMTRKKATALLDRLGRIRENSDSVRMYCLTEQGRKFSDARGGAPIPEAQEFWLL
ncbi:CRISPR-associated endonuclease Cas2 [Breoghania sp.]|uniref:CRISPR-associated endonuclease Cas2 n=1 Tax=Breoghania sp. TaxID=2065378 RepID=UPI002AA8AFE5|nr:CRISPR-associated endonuclease Cas2 [Breoghania sp.]